MGPCKIMLNHEIASAVTRTRKLEFFSKGVVSESQENSNISSANLTLWSVYFVAGGLELSEFGSSGKRCTAPLA
jgi:hypothetical protein